MEAKGRGFIPTVYSPHKNLESKVGKMWACPSRLNDQQFGQSMRYRNTVAADSKLPEMDEESSSTFSACEYSRRQWDSCGWLKMIKSC